MKLYWLRGGEEVEVEMGAVIGEEGKGTTVNMRFVTDNNEFKLGERVNLTTQQFIDIGWGCWVACPRTGREASGRFPANALMPLAALLRHSRSSGRPIGTVSSRVCGPSEGRGVQTERSAWAPWTPLPLKIRTAVGATL